ncbi:21842_t:CDS:2 [Entrophospora sp. SA101]|nr:21842_t:CDS:2 [Entrophospora sp. SA101]
MSSLSALMSSNELTFQCAIHEKWTLLLLFVRAVPALVLLNNQLEGNSSSSSSSSDSKEIEIFGKIIDREDYLILRLKYNPILNHSCNKC